MTHTLSVLERARLCRPPAPPHRRALENGSLTPAGRSFRDEAIDSHVARISYLADNISIDELAAVMPVLEKVRRLLDAERDGPLSWADQSLAALGASVSVSPSSASLNRIWQLSREFGFSPTL